MSSPSIERNKPLIYQGFRVPFDQLQPEKFEDFVRHVLEFLGPKLDFRITSQSGSSSDGGFDINAERISNSDKKVCIQCKRYEKSLSVGHVALELAKVALTSALEKSTVVEHYFVTTAKKTQELESALRQDGRGSLISDACIAATTHKDLKADCGKAISEGKDVQAIVTDYVRNLDRLEVWSGRDFDGKLGTVWSEIQGVLDRFFTVHTVLQEYPRPDFDEDAYLDQCCLCPSATIPAFCRPASLPANLELCSAADPRARKHSSPARPSTGSSSNASGPTVPVVETLAATSRGSCTILIGPGGGGKTRALESTRAHVAQMRIQDEEAPLPVVIELRNYEGDLGRLVGRALEINFGTWRSIPGNFLLLFDGLNELSHENASKLLREIDDLLSPRIAGVIATRDSGFRQRLVLSKIDRVFQLVPFDIRQTRNFASQSFGESVLEAFMTEFMRRLATPAASFLLLPFCVAASIEYFEENRTLPENRAALVEAILQRRFKRNNEQPLPPSLREMEIPQDTVRTIAEEVMFAMRIERNFALMNTSETTAIFRQAIEKGREENCFGADELTPTKVLELMCHFEFLARGPNDKLRLPHDLVVGYLAARPLSRVWRSKLPMLASTSATDDAWLFACGHIPRDELGDFWIELAKVDLMLAARAGAEAGGIARAMAERVLLYLDEQATTEFRVWEAANALALLGTPACVERLRANAVLPLDRSLRSLQNRRALARLGDEEFLMSILRGETTDNTVADTHDMWYSAPIDIALRLARREIDDAPTNQRLRLQLETITAFGDESDVERITQVFDAASDYFTSISAFQCLHKLHASHATQKMGQAMQSTGILGKVRITKLLHDVGATIDTEWLLSVMLGDFDDDLNSSAIGDDAKNHRFWIYLDAQKILAASSFNCGMKARIISAYPSADTQLRVALWDFAGVNDMEDFDRHAMNAIQASDPTEMGCVCLFLERRRLPEAKKQQFFGALIEWIHRPQKLGWGWQGYAVVDFLLKNGRTEPATTVGCGWLRTMLDAHRNLRQGQAVERYRHRNMDIQAEVHGVQPKVGMEHVLTWILALVSTLVPVANLLSLDGLDELFHIRISGLSDAQRRQALLIMFKRFGHEYVDEKVRLESDARQRISLLRITEPLLKFERIVQVLQEDAKFWVDRPGPLEMVFEVIDSRWNEQLAKALVDIVGQFSNWDPELDAQYFDDKLLIWVGQHLQREWVERFITPYWERDLHPTSHRILTFWYEMVTHQRNG